MLRKLDARIEEGGDTLGCITFEAAEKQAGRAAEVYFAMATAVKVFAEKKGVPAYKIYTSALKKAVTGDGRADKRTVVSNINRLFGTDLEDKANPPVDDDIADAIGVGYTAIEMFRRDMLRPSP